MGTYLTKLPGGDILQTEFEAIMARAKDLLPVEVAIVKSFNMMEAARFASGGGSTPWQSLAQSTLDYKSSHGYPSEILIRTQALEESLGASSGDFAGVDYGSDWVEVRTTAPYAIFHQEGQGRNPQRTIVSVSTAAVALWEIMLNTYVWHGLMTSPSESQMAQVI